MFVENAKSNVVSHANYGCRSSDLKLGCNHVIVRDFANRGVVWLIKIEHTGRGEWVLFSQEFQSKSSVVVLA